MPKFAALLILLLIAGCTAIGQAPLPPAAAPAPAVPAAFNLADVFPAPDRIPGWTSTGAARAYGRSTLFDLVDGQADAFFAYGFERVVTRTYSNSTGNDVHIEIWQLATPSDAFGLFSFARAGTPVAIGNEGDGDPGRRIAFWQHRYYAQVSAQQKLPDDELRNLAQAVAAALPTGGERPALLRRAPTDSRVGNTIFFRQEISIQSEIWLGGQNLLKLGQETEGILAHYDMGGTAARLVLVQYPDANRSAAGRRALESGPVKNLIAVDARGNLLGAVFGKADKAAAQQLLAQALGD